MVLHVVISNTDLSTCGAGSPLVSDCLMALFTTLGAGSKPQSMGGKPNRIRLLSSNLTLLT